MKKIGEKILIWQHLRFRPTKVPISDQVFSQISQLGKCSESVQLAMLKACDA